MVEDGNKDDEDAYWRELGETDLDGLVIGPQGTKTVEQRAERQAVLRKALISLVCWFHDRVGWHMITTSDREENHCNEHLHA